MGVPPKWFPMENPIKTDDFRGTRIYGNLQIDISAPAALGACLNRALGFQLRGAGGAWRGIHLFTQHGWSAYS